MIETQPFGRTGHQSSRVIFGAAALGFMSDERAAAVLETLLEFGVNHLDTAAIYGDSELRLAPWLRRHPDRFFLASKTTERSAAGARQGLERSLERLGVERLDLMQLHNLVDEAEWEQALGPGGALEALVEAREQGLVRFLGVTGHGTRVAAMHRRSLERFAFDSVLLPCNFSMLQNPDYAADFQALVSLCRQRGVAVQTIKAVARRRWVGEGGRRFSWYEPLRDPDALRRAVHFVLADPDRHDLFLNSSSDATLLRPILEAAAEVAAGKVQSPSAGDLEADVTRFGIEPLFVPGVAETV